MLTSFIVRLVAMTLFAGMMWWFLRLGRSPRGHAVVNQNQSVS